MRLLVASDLHGSPDSLNFLIGRARALRPDRIVLLGDLLYHGPRNPLPAGYGPMGMPDLFRTLMDVAPVVSIRGNCDAEIDLVVLPFPMAESAILDVDGLLVYASHGHHIPERPPMPGFAQGTVFLRGHTHVPRGETIGGYSFWNPGSMTIPKQGSPRSYAIIEDGTFTVYDFAGTAVLSHTPPRPSGR